jgi:hypothetical protein
MSDRPSLLTLLSVAAMAFVVACGATSAPPETAEERGKVFSCRSLGSGAQAEVFVNGSCIGTANSFGLSDECWTKPRVEKENPPLFADNSPSRRYGAKIWGSFPNEVGCSIHLTLQPERELYRQKLAFHSDFFPDPSRIDPLFKGTRLELSPLQAKQDETGWVLTFKGAPMTRLERAGLEQRSVLEPVYRGPLGGHADGAIDCRGIARIGHLRTLCSDPKKAVFDAVLECGATVQLEGRRRTEWQQVDGVTSREVTPFEMSVGFTQLRMESVGPNSATADLDYFRQTGQPPPSCSMR